MKWEHTCSLDWLKERQKHLCASEIKKLVPLTPTGRKRAITDEDFMKVYVSKMRTLTTDDCMSYGPAARGHILEPFAIEELNKFLDNCNYSIRFHHWDDVVVTGKGNRPLAYSPDALDVPQSEVVDKRETLYLNTAAERLAEIKSYNAEKHIECMMSLKMDLQERWQIATAMASDSMIISGFLVFFNPALKDYKIGINQYDRADLEKEIETVREIKDQWRDFIERIPSINCYSFPSVCTEEAIIAKLESESKLNP